MGYTVVDDEGAQGSGLTLAEAFARMMAFARCDYAFGRTNGDMHLSLTQSDDAPSETGPPPALQSKLLDDVRARAEIMRRFLKHGFNGYRIMTDEDWQREERKLCEQQGYRPARRIDVE
ncbi:MAG TPA: hypothetical protein VGG11_22905 [Xanthobacteraceae bacterium]|jgi:hypothetical protein